jgi:DNA-binding response OmpR family regulator
MYVLVSPESPSQSLISALLTIGYQPVPIAGIDDAVTKEPDSGWAAGIIELGNDPSAAITLATKIRDELAVSILIVVDRTLTADLSGESGFDDFILTPTDPTELRIRLERIGLDANPTADGAVLTFRDLQLNTANYQATIAGAPTDLTYMEYELLRFLVEHPNRVWSREQILSKVWGYDYFGGSRTVDVHVRRLRAKLGEERSSWITTVRSVGYRFG